MYNIYTQQKYHSMDVIVIGISWYLRWNISWVLFFAIIVGASCSLLLSASFNTILMPLCSPLSCILECDDSINLGYKFQIMWRLAVIQFADSHAPLFVPLQVCASVRICIVLSFRCYDSITVHNNWMRCQIRHTTPCVIVCSNIINACSYRFAAKRTQTALYQYQFMYVLFVGYFTCLFILHIRCRIKTYDGVCVCVCLCERAHWALFLFNETVPEANGMHCLNVQERSNHIVHATIGLMGHNRVQNTVHSFFSPISETTLKENASTIFAKIDFSLLLSIYGSYCCWCCCCCYRGDLVVGQFLLKLLPLLSHVIFYNAVRFAIYIQAITVIVLPLLLLYSYIVDCICVYTHTLVQTIWKYRSNNRKRSSIVLSSNEFELMNFHLFAFILSLFCCCCVEQIIKQPMCM